MNDTVIKNYCIWARAELLNEVENRMQRYGVVVEGAEPAEAETVGGVALSVQERKQRIELLELQTRIGHDALRDRAAYTWFNRIVAIRFMELHDYLPSGIRMFGSANDANAFEPQVVKEALDVDLSSANQMEVVRLMQTGEDEPLFRYLFLAQCDELAQLESLKRVFEPVGSALELLLPTGLLRKESVIGQLIEQLPYVEQGDGIGWDNVEILGWMYQFYNSEVKDEFFKSKRKATARDIAPATQLFTPEWIVRYMVENSLGRLWMLNNPESMLREHMEYYIEPDVEHEDFIRIEGPEDISLCDPACGSGHILVYAFSLLFQMYTECGYREREVPQLILEDNLTGMEIDPRAAQIANLALAMCAREYDRRFFNRGVEADINVIAPTVFEEGELPESAALLCQPQLLDALARLDEIGSLLNPTEAELTAVCDDAQRFAEAGQASLFGANVAEKLQQAKQTCETLARKFTCVVGNPPYMGSGSFSPFMSKWIKKNYPDVKSDLCTCFIERIMGLCEESGLAGITASNSWMFLSSFEKLRENMVNIFTIETLVQLSVHGFHGIAAQVCTFVLRNSYSEGYLGGYIRLNDFDHHSLQQPKTLEAIANPDCGYFYRCNAKTFTQIPGTPIVYWIGGGLINAFSERNLFEDVAHPKVGMQTSNNDKYLRLWWESDFEPSDKTKKWIKYLKGGSYRKWYGNYEWVLLYKDDPDWIREQPNARVLDESFLDFPKVTWTDLTSGANSFRFAPKDTFYDISGHCYFPSALDQFELLAYSNSSVFSCALKMINSTMHCQVGDVARVPYIRPGQDLIGLIDSVSKSQVEKSKLDWDSFETSWDFKRHPLV